MHHDIIYALLVVFICIGIGYIIPKLLEGDIDKPLEMILVWPIILLFLVFIMIVFPIYNSIKTWMKKLENERRNKS